MAIEGSASAEISAPIEEVFAVAADVEGSPRWQPEIKHAECLERNADGHQVLVRTESDAKVRTLSSTLRFGCDDPTGISWKQTEGDVKSVRGSWELEDLWRRPHPRHVLDGGRPGPDARHGHPRPAGRRPAWADGREHARQAEGVRRGLRRRVCDDAPGGAAGANAVGLGRSLAPGAPADVDLSSVYAGFLDTRVRFARPFTNRTHVTAPCGRYSERGASTPIAVPAHQPPLSELL